MECNWEQEVACDLYFLEFTCCSFEVIILGDNPVISMRERLALQRSGPGVNFTQSSILGYSVLSHPNSYLLQQSHWLLLLLIIWKHHNKYGNMYGYVSSVKWWVFSQKRHPKHLAYLTGNTGMVMCTWMTDIRQEVRAKPKTQASGTCH